MGEMETAITPEQINQAPSLITASFQTRDGESVVFRPLATGDAKILGEFFCNLSEATIDLFGPHDFDQETADRLCAEIVHSQVLRMIPAIRSGGGERVIGYFLLQFGISEATVQRYRGFNVELDAEVDCQIAPSMADDYQNQGLGSPLFGHIIDVAQRTNRRRVVLIGGVRGINARAIHFYRKHGFVKVSEFKKRGNNYDMMLEL